MVLGKAIDLAAADGNGPDRHAMAQQGNCENGSMVHISEGLPDIRLGQIIPDIDGLPFQRMTRSPRFAPESGLG